MNIHWEDAPSSECWRKRPLMQEWLHALFIAMKLIWILRLCILCSIYWQHDGLLARALEFKHFWIISLSWVWNLPSNTASTVHTIIPVHYPKPSDLVQLSMFTVYFECIFSGKLMWYSFWTFFHYISDDCWLRLANSRLIQLLSGSKWVNYVSAACSMLQMEYHLAVNQLTNYSGAVAKSDLLECPLPFCSQIVRIIVLV